MNFLIAIPVYNEQRHLERVLDAVEHHTDNILVINDGSTDGTGNLLNGRTDLRVITHLENRGYGQSLIHAFGYAERFDFDWVITMDCDEQHEPQAIPDFLAAIADDDADVISGSRYLRNHTEDDTPPPERRRINMLINRWLEHMLGLRLSDSFCGFKAHRVTAMQRLNLSEPGYAFPLQFWPQCVRAGLRIREIPVRCIYRDRNRSFGATLDDPDARLQHYREVLLAELCSEPSRCVCSSYLVKCRND